MIFFKDEAPHVEDYDKVRDELLKLKWLQKIYNIENNRNVYDVTGIGYQYYFAICMSVNRDQLFGGPKLTMGQDSAYIQGSIDLHKEGFLIDGIDGTKMTPMAAEYLYVLTDSHGKVVQATIKLKNGRNTKKDTNWGEKLGNGFASFMKGMQGVSKIAQQYDKHSTGATRNAWSTEKSVLSPNKASGYKKRKKKTTRRKKRRYYKS